MKFCSSKIWQSQKLFVPLPSNRMPRVRGDTTKDWKTVKEFFETAEILVTVGLQST